MGSGVEITFGESQLMSVAMDMNPTLNKEVIRCKINIISVVLL